MGRGDFRGAVAVAAVMAVATVLVAAAYDLPVRDPDGVSIPTWVRLPAIVLLAVALDVVPRWVAATRRDQDGAWQALRGVVRERWNRDQVRFTVIGLAAWYVSYVAFRNLKGYLPFVTERLWDTELASADRLLWLGHDPADVLHQVLGTGWAAWLMSGVYVLWIGLVPAMLAIALVWTRRSRTGELYVTAVSFNWLIGVAVYYLVPSLGPIYSAPRDFAGLPDTFNTGVQDLLLDDRVTVLAGAWDTRAVQTIAAFASLHVAITVTTCLVAELIRLPRWIRVTAWTFAVLTSLSTVYLGWHFFVDVVAGAAVGVVAVVLGARVTGHPLRRRDQPWSRPALVREDAQQAAD
ncbi:phosphatase PAP2 family protein [Nocardioides sp. zg-1308]|uniref:Phosphatase PAP2 family protein n=1 Tax=Nocardioides renjunii TaxID=3095075 RepID=A0ABU5K5N7_9ACTN|nr:MULTISPECIES: phosphatase PAP2 family protein [unclassified Nocardioides]MDZ5660285.1 phosphatase PAP2 family protein [Nocardioides sp. S-58]NPD03397.1 phosphatase PAP2 family protein [Nocardioides sp. zg-1308]